MPVRHFWATTCLAIVLAACGGGSLTLSEYAAESEELVTTAITGIQALDAEWESQNPTPDGARDYWERRLVFRRDFLEGIRNLDPPKEFVDMHAYALDLFSRLVAAEEAIAAQVETLETVDGHGPWWDTPEGQAARAVDQEAIAICHAAQAEFDATQDREILAGTPWLTNDLKEVVRVAFGCPP